jgi:hypothetical protein
MQPLEQDNFWNISLNPSIYLLSITFSKVLNKINQTDMVGFCDINMIINHPTIIYIPRTGRILEKYN